MAGLFKIVSKSHIGLSLFVNMVSFSYAQVLVGLRPIISKKKYKTWANWKKTSL